MFSELHSVLRQGGPILWCLLLLGVGLYTMLAATWFGLRKVKKEMGDTYLQNEQRHSGQGRRQIIGDFTTFELDRLAWVERRLPFIGVLAGAAPLAGLLGTVSGMLVTFSGLATSSTAKPIDKISVGISEALITTQAGLLIAIPAAFLLALLRKQTQVTHAALQQHMHSALIAEPKRG
ncbi:MotA/TolQ/ExbB proton channel family protein [Verrucomicrobiaceae bacterium R5-34]|uniref:MotA/TolQ/ExbB proton channel family protein n=1 Tax=Oceaniferula flava TaxID=2800421 RepID=A0AAE2SCX0_9BACT|nr:MotA/TolQ/ExbB proton channel family protein [Oceaniferula flavus]MBK1830494.1 MotA/TolQ/ExbB proton channel family protein [Verrucomicrobiaceae bacterium R5-34]MBK1854589.1 MotA/TolQ/ExbB proton channel family protein [Oceaniferula flavus]MBM1135895.1 MotA/TolQ/ExbB proton channel family protein [Oceaniferula flavus]